MWNEENRISIFNKSNVSRKGEAAFLNTLKSHYPKAQVLNENFAVSQSSLEQPIYIEQILNWLQTDTLLSSRKRSAFIEVLRKLNLRSLRVALNPNQISFDIVLRKSNKIYYWEFHEKQHASLRSDRISRVYTSYGSAVEVPRYFQRFVRDIWRTLYFRPYTIV